MKSIAFVIKVRSYLEAATVEEWLKKEGIQYEERINTGEEIVRQDHSPSESKPIRRLRLTGKDFSHIRNLIEQHPNWPDRKLKEHHELKFSTQTINRIRNGHYNERFISQHLRVAK